MKLFIVLLFLGHLSPATELEKSSQPLTVEDLIHKVQEDSEVARATEKTIQSIELEIQARDLLLGLQLNAEAATVDDNRDQVTFARRTKYEFLTFSLAKPFSTGTTLLLSGNHEDSLYDNLGPRNNEAWEVRMTQSLWRDFFGNATGLRRAGEKAELTSRKAQAYFERQNFILTIEQIYWDLSLAVKEEQIRLKNIENGKKLEMWTRRRAANSAAEKSDLLQAQALVSQATLDLMSSQNEIARLKNQLKQNIPSFLNTEDIAISDTSILQDRKIESLVVSDKTSGEPRRLDTLSAAYLARQAEFEAQKVKDSFRPKVDLYASYGQNGISTNFDNAWDRAMDADHSISKVGVVLSVDLSRGLVADRIRSAELAAEAKILQAQAQNRLSHIGWEDLLRQIQILKLQAQESSKLADLQQRKVVEERSRFRVGRSTVFQLVSYELDAANSELNKYRALVNLRKAEGQARLFTTMVTEDKI